MTTQCGYIVLMGAPNAGKSTLLNTILGTKISIVTHKVQTTRQRVLGIHQQNQAQMIFCDTPGIFKPNKPLEKFIVREAWRAGQDGDLHCLLLDANRLIELNDLEKDVLKFQNVCVLLNKVDRVEKEKLLQWVDFLSKNYQVQNIFMISALKGEGVQGFLQWIEKELPNGPWLYDPEQLTDRSERTLASDLTREKILLNLNQEVPYEIMVETEKWEHFNNGSLKIQQVIYVARSSQKKIVIGHGGGVIKKIRLQAQKEMEQLWECPIHLFLFVKVADDWVNKDKFIEKNFTQTSHTS